MIVKNLSGREVIIALRDAGRWMGEQKVLPGKKIDLYSGHYHITDATRGRHFMVTEEDLPCVGCYFDVDLVLIFSEPNFLRDLADL